LQSGSHSRKQRQYGFTMIELIIAIAIIGILSAIAVPMLTSNIRSAKNADAQNTLRSIYLMQKNYFSENACYFVNGGAGDMTSTINQVLLGSTTPLNGPIAVGNSNDFYFYALPGVVGQGGTCIGNQSNDYVVYAKSKSTPTLIFHSTSRTLNPVFKSTILADRLCIMFLIYALLIGLMVGSFLNVVIHRLPKALIAYWDENKHHGSIGLKAPRISPFICLITPKSTSPCCGEKLSWYENIPVLSWLWLNGKCRHCASPISIRYLLVEGDDRFMFLLVRLAFW